MGEAGEIRETADRRVGDTLAKADGELGTVEEVRQAGAAGTRSPRRAY